MAIAQDAPVSAPPEDKASAQDSATVSGALKSNGLQKALDFFDNSSDANIKNAAKVVRNQLAKFGITETSSLTDEQVTTLSENKSFATLFLSMQVTDSNGNKSWMYEASN